MYNQNPKLELKELPPRAEKLSPSEIQNIFGGCGKYNDSCNKNSDCCDSNCSTYTDEGMCR